MSESVVITHNENGGGDDLDSSLSGEKHIHTPEGSVHDVIEENHDGLNKGKKRVNTFSSETESVQAVIPNDGDKASESVVNYHEENTSGDSLDISPNGEKNIRTPENGSVPDANEDNRDRMNKGEEGVNTSSSETESVPGVIPKDGFEVPQDVGITCGDGLDISPNGEIQTHEKGLVPDVNEDNHDRINKGKKTVNTSSSETGSVQGVIPQDGKEVPQSVVITYNENTYGDGLNVSPNGEKDIHTHEKADANKNNHDRSNKVLKQNQYAVTFLRMAAKCHKV